MAWITSAEVVAPVSNVRTTSPLRRTVILSEIRKTSSMRCDV
jgi:hypothetical protein